MVTMFMLYVIHLCILQNALPESDFSWEVCYIYLLFRRDSPTAPQLYLSLYWYVCSLYNVVCVDMFVYVIQYNCWLYFILGFFSCISPMYRWFFHCTVIKFTFLLLRLWLLYLCLLRYFVVLHMIFSLVVIHIDRTLIHIYFIWFVMPLLPSALTFSQKIGLTSPCLN